MTINTSSQPTEKPTLTCHSSGDDPGESGINSPKARSVKGAACWILLLIALPVLIGSVIACQPNPPSPSDESSVRAFADPATDTTLQGLSESSLAKYTQYGNSQFKAAVTQEVLNQVAAQVSNQFGTYVSKEYLRLEELQGYIVVHYKAKYTKGNVGIKMSFDRDHLVAGQFFE